MKPYIFLPFFLLLVPCALAASAPNPVIDTFGRYLRQGVSYYIVPVPPEDPTVSSRGGGLNLAATRNKTCPLDVVQEMDENNKGLPFSFIPINPKKGVIRESTDLNIKYMGDTACNESMVWMLNQLGDPNGPYFVTTGGVEGHPGAQTIGNWFKIEVFIDDYKIMYCPTVCKYCKVICRDVGIVVVNGRRYLGLTDQPRRVMFKTQ
ncbi:hypothetical protein ACET3Z_011585 [Daucus carota]